MPRPPSNVAPRTRRRAFALPCALALSTLACKAAPQLPPTEAPPQPSAIAKLAAGTALAVRRPTPQVAVVSLWLDVGALDADPPSLASAAAQWVARGRAEARVYPTAIELRTLCDSQTEAMSACAARLTAALHAAPPSAADATSIREELRAMRQAWRADDGYAAEWAAFAALSGEQAERALPVGADSDDARLDDAAITRFIGSYFKPEHAILVGAGDLETADLSGALGRAAPATAPALPTLTSHDGVRAVIGGRNVAAFALAVPNARVGAAIAQGFRDAFAHGTARVSEQRGLAIVHARLEGADQLVERVSTGATTLQRLTLEYTTLRDVAAPETLDGIVQSIGEEWIGRLPRPALAYPWPLGVGVSVLGGREASAADDEKQLQRARDDIAHALDAVMQRNAPSLHGDTDARSADLKLDNGVRIQLERRPGDRWFAAALRFEGGSTRDPATRHGRAALTAVAMSSGCGGEGVRTLETDLPRIGAHLRPLVDGEGIGVLVTAPAEQAHAALDLLLRCATRPALSSSSAADARARLLRVLNRDPAPRLHAALAQLLAPLAPGAFAAWGTPVGVAATSVQELQRFHSDSTVGTRTRLWIAADAPDDELVQFAARRLAALPEARPLPAIELGAAVGIDGVQEGNDPLTAIVGVRAAANEAGGAAAEIFAQAFAEALSERAGPSFAAWGEQSNGTAASGVALRLTEEALPQLAIHCRDALKELANVADEVWRSRLNHAWAERSLRLSNTAGAVDAAFYRRSARPRSLDDEFASVKRLSQAEAVFAVLRPRP